MFPELLRLALVVGVAISRLLAPSRGCGAAAAGARDAGYDSTDIRLLVNSESLVRRSLLGHGVGSTFWREPPENSQPQKHQSPHGGGQWLNRIVASH
jgi:hypothetical protein